MEQEVFIQMVLYLMVIVVIIGVLKSTNAFNIIMRRIGYIGIREIHYNINQKVVRQIKLSCHLNKDKEIKNILLVKDSIARPKRVHYTGHIITPDIILITWKKNRLLPFNEKVSPVLHNMVQEALGTDFPIQANAFFNHDLIWLPVPTRKYLIDKGLNEKKVFDNLFQSFVELIDKQFLFDIENIGVENTIRGARMSKLWESMVRSGDQLPKDFSTPNRQNVREVENE